MTIYRKIWQSNFGPIPKDEFGRSYHIHHIDGNRKNNDISNLKCVSIQEHYNIHYSQQDWAACFRLAQLMEMDVSVISNLMSLSNKKRVRNKTHHFLSGKIQKKANEDRIKNGTHNFLGGKITKEQIKNKTHPFVTKCDGTNLAKLRVLKGTHNWQGNYGSIFSKDLQKRRVEKGTHNFLNQEQILCPNCKAKSGRKGPMTRHINSCRRKTST